MAFNGCFIHINFVSVCLSQKVFQFVFLLSDLLFYVAWYKSCRAPFNFKILTNSQNAQKFPIKAPVGGVHFDEPWS